MHRIDTATAQVDKFGPGKNGFTNGDPATGRRATDLNSDMWDAVQEEICAVIEQSGLDLDKDQHNQLYQAIIKIITGKIPDALLKKNNLSDLADKANARANLQLKAAATRDVTTSSHDVTAGRVLKVGDYGLGVGNGGVKLLASIYDITCSGEYNAMGSGTTSPTVGIPADSGNTRFAVYAGNIYSNQYLVTLTSNVHFYVGLVKTAEKIAVWSKFYNTLNKPNAGDVGALPISGGQMLGAIRGSADGAGSYASQNNANVLAPFFQRINDAATSKFFPIIKQRYAQGNGTWSLGTIISAGNFQLHYVSQSDPAGKAFTFTKDGQFMPGSYANFDARYQAKGNYTPAGQAYTKAESDGRFQPKGSYTPAGQAYTKAESDARFVRDVRLGAQVLVSASANGSYASLTAPSGHQLTAILDRDTSRWPMPDSPDSAYARPVQKFINNQWVTVSQL